MPAKPIYRVVFLNQGKVYEVYARHVSQTGSLFGFVEIEELVFDARKGIVVDPAEERLQIEFAGVKKTYVPMHYVLLHWMGDERGNQIPEGVCMTPLSIPIGTQMLHATGIAWAFKMRKEPRVAITYFGDGATSEGDFHEAMNSGCGTYAR